VKIETVHGLREKYPHPNPTDLLKEAAWLAWNHSIIRGKGVIQANPGATKEDLWGAIAEAHDYDGNPLMKPRGETEGMYYNMDYVFGKAMKLRVTVCKDGILIPVHTPDGNYETWSWKYPTFKALFDTASEHLNGHNPRPV
jgi:hypothetical protein